MKNESDCYCVQIGQFGEGFERSGKIKGQISIHNFDLNYTQSSLIRTTAKLPTFVVLKNPSNLDAHWLSAGRFLAGS